MPWNNDTFQYTTGTLRGIAGNYEFLYIDGSWNALFSIAESKADFDTALSAIGRGNWCGLTGHRLGDYRYFGRLQQTIIAVILGIGDGEMEARGFRDVKDMRSKAYQRMRDALNRGKLR